MQLLRCGIVELSHHAYHNPAEAVTTDPSLDREIQRIARRLEEVSSKLEEAGIPHDGIAAPQIGEPVRMVYIGGACLINPAWEQGRIGVRTRLGQSCLSSVGTAGSPKRLLGIRASWQDLNGEVVEQKLAGGESHIFQHEVDHLDETLFVDHLFEAGERVDYVHVEHAGIYYANTGRRAQPWPERYRYSTAQWEVVGSGLLTMSMFRPPSE
jgi:peptide deformylase